VRTEKCILAGFGGQGIMLMGQLLAQAALDDGLEVSWLPSYGPEMRGGTANCSVIISPEPIPSPVIAHDATSLIVMNLPSMEKFVRDLVPGGYVLVNSSLIDAKVTRSHIEAIYVPCNDIALELGNLKMTNMVMVGAFVQVTRCVRPESVLGALERKLGAGKAHLMEGNRLAFARGAECALAVTGS
jgi:2-oxoglutarate ferredoxin oxidoreductase subunit gamma